MEWKKLKKLHARKCAKHCDLNVLLINVYISIHLCNCNHIEIWNIQHTTRLDWNSLSFSLIELLPQTLSIIRVMVSLTFVSVLLEHWKIKYLLPFSKAVGTDMISVTQGSIASIVKVPETARAVSKLSHILGKAS